jgi:hypothetical protein
LRVGGQGVGDGHAPVQLAAGHVEVEHLCEMQKQKREKSGLRAGLTRASVHFFLLSLFSLTSLT